MKELLTIVQIVIAILLIIFILLQQRGTALGSGFGGGSEVYSSRRGIQKKLFTATVAVGIIYIVLAFLNLVL